MPHRGCRMCVGTRNSYRCASRGVDLLVALALWLIQTPPYSEDGQGNEPRKRGGKGETREKNRSKDHRLLIKKLGVAMPRCSFPRENPAAPPPFARGSRVRNLSLPFFHSFPSLPFARLRPTHHHHHHRPFRYPLTYATYRPHSISYRLPFLPRPFPLFFLLTTLFLLLSPSSRFRSLFSHMTPIISSRVSILGWREKRFSLALAGRPGTFWENLLNRLLVKVAHHFAQSSISQLTLPHVYRF